MGQGVSRRLLLTSRVIQEGFMVVKMALEKISVPELRLPQLLSIPPMIHDLLSSRTGAIRSSETAVTNSSVSLHCYR
jgi:hypothetical protein